MPYIHMYQGNPTEGGTDGSAVSEGTGLAPINVSLNATNNEISSNIKLALRCDAGYNTTENTTITPTGTTAAKWALSIDGVTFGDYGAVLTVASVIGTTNKVFYAKAKATSDEVPVNDTTVDLAISATIAAV